MFLVIRHWTKLKFKYFLRLDNSSVQKSWYVVYESRRCVRAENADSEIVKTCGVLLFISCVHFDLYCMIANGSICHVNIDSYSLGAFCHGDEAIAIVGKSQDYRVSFIIFHWAQENLMIFLSFV